MRCERRGRNHALSAHPILCVQVVKQGSHFTFDESRAMMRELSQSHPPPVSRHTTQICANLSPLLDRTTTLDGFLGRFSNRRAAVLMAAFKRTTSSAVSDRYGAAYRTMPPTTAAITSWDTDTGPKVFLHTTTHIPLIMVHLDPNNAVTAWLCMVAKSTVPYLGLRLDGK